MRTLDTDSGLGRARGGPVVRRIVGSLLASSPLLFGVPVVIGIVTTITNILATAHPNLLWATTVNVDAKEIYLGHALYQNPAHGYTGLIYTPLFPALLGLVYHISLWEGWPVLIVIAATVYLLCLTADVAYARTGPGSRLLRGLAAVGIGAIAYWCVSSLNLPVLEEARADQLAWAFALGGLIAVADFGPSPSYRRTVLAALLLSAAFWTKQSTIGAMILAGGWVMGLSVASALSRRATWMFLAVLAGVNLGLLLLLNLLTNGWEFYFNFELARAQWASTHYWSLYAKELNAIVLAIVFAALIWMVSALATKPRLRVARQWPGFLTASDSTGRRAALLGLYAVFGFALAVYFEMKQGTNDNQMIGEVWTLGLLAAGGWRLAQRSTHTAVLAGGCVALLFVLAQVASVREVAANADVNLPDLERVTHWQEVSRPLLRLARSYTVYTPLDSDLNVPQVTQLYPNYYDIADLLAAGKQPLYLVDALLSSRFDYIEPFPLDQGNEEYTSAFGKWEENYLWKLDQVILARYAESPGLPEGLLARRLGPEQDAWMRQCFGPFSINGTSFRIGHGGGFWCSFKRDRLRLMQTPAPVSEVLTERPTRVSGRITVTFGAAGASHVDLLLERRGAPVWTAHVTAATPGSSRLVLSTYLGNKLIGSTTVTASRSSGGQRDLQIGVTTGPDLSGSPSRVGLGTASLAVPSAPATFALTATTGVGIDLSAARFGGQA